MINRLINGFGLGPMLANDLARADLKMTAAEYAMICIAPGDGGLSDRRLARGDRSSLPGRWSACRGRPGRLRADHLSADAGREARHSGSPSSSPTS